MEDGGRMRREGSPIGPKHRRMTVPRGAPGPGETRGPALEGVSGRGRKLAALARRFARQGLRGEVVYLTMREAIIREVFEEGERLPDRVLAQMLGVSRTPVREALQRLAAEGFVENVPRLGLVVAEITPQDIEDIYVIRIALEGVAARLAAERASASEVEAMAALNEQIASATARGDLEAMTALNRRFHETIYRAGRNARLTQLLMTFHDAVQRFRRSTLSVPERARETIEEHRRLVEAIRSRNAAEAERLARLHKERAKDVRLAIIREGRRFDERRH
jgi:DNA-binding GntR family transcriptional regulator